MSIDYSFGVSRMILSNFLALMLSLFAPTVHFVNPLGGVPNPTSITNGVSDRWYLRPKWPSDPDTKGRVLVIYQPTLYTLTPFRVNKGVKDIDDLTGGRVNSYQARPLGGG